MLRKIQYFFKKLRFFFLSDNFNELIHAIHKIIEDFLKIKESDLFELRMKKNIHITLLNFDTYEYEISKEGKKCLRKLDIFKKDYGLLFLTMLMNKFTVIN